MKELDAFPATLQELIAAELAAGNKIVTISAGFPAPRNGAFVMLQELVSSRPRASTNGLTFRDHNTTSWAGEFTDAQRRYFVLELPYPPERERNMANIREEMNARERAATPEFDH